MIYIYIYVSIHYDSLWREPEMNLHYPPVNQCLGRTQSISFLVKPIARPGKLRWWWTWRRYNRDPWCDFLWRFLMGELVNFGVWWCVYKDYICVDVWLMFKASENLHIPWKWWLEDAIPFSNGPFSWNMFVFGGVYNVLLYICIITVWWRVNLQSITICWGLTSH